MVYTRGGKPAECFRGGGEAVVKVWGPEVEFGAGDVAGDFLAACSGVVRAKEGGVNRVFGFRGDGADELIEFCRGRSKDDEFGGARWEFLKAEAADEVAVDGRW